MSFEGALISTGMNQLVNFFTKRADAIQREIQKGIAVFVKQDPNAFSRTEIEDITVTNKKWSTKPALEFKNNLTKSSIVEEISLVADTAYKTKGKCYVTIDDSVILLAKKTFTIFGNIKESKVRCNKTIKQDSKIKLFMLSSDGTAVGLTMQVTFGE